MSDMPLSVESKFPMSESKKATSQDINTAVKDVVSKAREEQQDKASFQTEKRLSPASNDLVESVDATFLSRLKEFPEKARHVLRFQNVALTASALPILAACTFGSAEKQNTPPPPTPTPASDFLPEGMPSETVQFNEISNILEAQTIDSIETYGIDRPLNKSQLTELYKKLNSVEREMRDDTYYGTIFVEKITYDNLETFVENDTFQKFIKRHEDFFNQMVSKQPYPNTNKLSIRRLIVVEDGLFTPLAWLNEFIKDSDGGWQISGISDPHEALDYFDQDTGIDYGLLHELGHTVFHLPDQYSLDFNSEIMFPNSIPDDIPIQWRSYFASRRPDIGSDLMNTVGHYIGLHANLQLLRRIQEGNVHDSKKTGPETAWDFPYEIPEKTTFAFGKYYTNANVNIFRSREANEDEWHSRSERKKKLELIGNYVNSENGSLTLPKNTLFPIPNNENNLIKAEDSVLLLRITTEDGKNYFRWMDIRDFNIPYWLGHKDHVTMNLKLASEKDHPESFDWEIKYSNGNPNPPLPTK